MKRKSQKYNIDNFLEEYPQFSQQNVEIWIDEQNSKEIKTFLTSKKKNGGFRHEKRFKIILWKILIGQYEDEIYGSEKMSEKSKNVTAMKFKDDNNTRIYCKEIYQNGKKIIMIVKYSKKVNKNDKRIKTLVDNIGGYEYDF